MSPEVASAVATALSTLAVAGFIAIVRVLIQMRDLVQRETTRNGGTSSKDHMERTSRAIEAIRADQATQRDIQAKQTRVLEEIRDQSKEHNELTARMVGALIDRR